MIHYIVKKEFLPLIKDNKEFFIAIQLSRILSAIRYNNVIFAKLINEVDIHSGIGFYLFFNHAALIFEGIKTFNCMKSKTSHLETYKSYSNKIEKMLSDINDENSTLRKIFKTIRDKISFHFDDDVTKEIFGLYVDKRMKEQKDIIFLGGKTKKIVDMEYGLASDMNFNYILSYIDDQELSDKEKLIKISKELAELSNAFSEIIEFMMAELINDVCEIREET